MVVGQSATRAVSHPHPVSPRVAGIREVKLRMRRERLELELELELELRTGVILNQHTRNESHSLLGC